MNTTRRLTVNEAENYLDKYFPVLDYGFIALKDYMGGDLAVEQAARVSYGAGTRKVSETRNLIRYLVRNNHSSPLEMTEIQFHIAMPIVVMRQWVRHRMHSMNEYSGRYSIMPLIYYTPDHDNVCKQASNNKQGRAEPVADKIYKEFTELNQVIRNQTNLVYKWTTEQDIAREIARLDLPLSTYTYCYWKSDLRNIFNLLKLRLDSHAQWEIRQYARVMAGIVKAIAPLCFEAFEDYQLNSVQFSQDELSMLELATNTEMDNFPYVKAELARKGLSKREIEEFLNKLIPRPKVNYDLDLASAKTGEHYMEIIQRHAYEQPTS